MTTYSNPRKYATLTDANGGYLNLKCDEDKTSTTFKPIDGTFPDWRRVIPDCVDHEDNAKERDIQFNPALLAKVWKAATADKDPTEYRILLTTGGPALQIVGALSEHGEPENARLQSQDWGTPWTDVPLSALIGKTDPSDPNAWQVDGDIHEAFSAIERNLLTFAQCFYFGE